MQTFRRALPALKDKNKSQNDNEPSQNQARTPRWEKEGLRQLSLISLLRAELHSRDLGYQGVASPDEAGEDLRSGEVTPNLD